MSEHKNEIVIFLTEKYLGYWDLQNFECSQFDKCYVGVFKNRFLVGLTHDLSDPKVDKKSKCNNTLTFLKVKVW